MAGAINTLNVPLGRWFANHPASGRARPALHNGPIRTHEARDSPAILPDSVRLSRLPFWQRVRIDSSQHKAADARKLFEQQLFEQCQYLQRRRIAMNVQNQQNSDHLSHANACVSSVRSWRFLRCGVTGHTGSKVSQNYEIIASLVKSFATEVIVRYNQHSVTRSK